MAKRRTAQQITLDERKEIALSKLYLWEYATALTLSLSALKRRDEYLERVLQYPLNNIDRDTRAVQLAAIRDAGIARGIYTPADEE